MNVADRQTKGQGRGSVLRVAYALALVYGPVVLGVWTSGGLDSGHVRATFLKYGALAPGAVPALFVSRIAQVATSPGTAGALALAAAGITVLLLLRWAYSVARLKPVPQVAVGSAIALIGWGQAHLISLMLLA